MGRPPLHRTALTFKPTPTIKFLCSYGGKILPRYPDGELRYHGGETRLLAFNRSISFSGNRLFSLSLSLFHFPIDLVMVFNFGVSESYTTDLLLKFGELCGTSISVSFRCQLPKEDLDALVSITSDEDLANLIEEYDRAASSSSSSSLKIRAFLFPPKYAKRISPPSSMASFSSSSSLSSMSAAHRCFRRMSPPHASYLERSASAVPCSVYNIQGSSSRMFVHNGRSWE
ncbi:uncharacterized protein LOC111804876 isoform X2 [Cucurbita pepo subsp. pepo]|uniref:uncharacterized protein LOC111804876 isoform X2 n=1 Tax=Cucurbita pepo subsp. pepo TaxID=3664 RepID=UPI000C9D28B8|nr:uncharacterized protein LOC111804876 isoform X2 [Cucurbita pepo subsp. pepo]